MKKIVIYSNNSGHTLIELLLIITIISVLVTVSWKTLGEGKQNAMYDNACSLIAGMINKTRNYALTGRTVDGFSPQSYAAYLNANGITVYQYDKGGNYRVADSVTLPNGITISNNPLPYYWYTVPDGTMSSVNGNVINFTGTTKQVVVSAGSAICQ